MTELYHLGKGSMINKKTREIVYDKYNQRCAYCGVVKNMQVAKQRVSQHHLLKELSNLNPSCRSCNKFKDTFTIEMFREQINKFRKYHPTFNLAERYGLFTCNEEVKVKFYFEE